MKPYLLVLMLFSGFATAPLAAQTAPVPIAPANSAFRVGDAVRVTVWRNPDLGGLFEIGDAGTVMHPLYRSIRLAGLSLEQAEAEFRQVLERFEERPEFVIEPLFRVAISGEIRSPNVYTLTPHTTVAQAVAQAGGPTPTARIRRVRLLRDQNEIPVDLTRPYSELIDLRLRSGDQIILDRRRSVWREVIHPTLTTAGSLASLAWMILRVSGSL